MRPDFFVVRRSCTGVVQNGAVKSLCFSVKLHSLNFTGAPGVTRTRGTQIRNLVLYPPELRGHRSDFNRLQEGYFCGRAFVTFCDISDLTEDVNPFRRLNGFLLVLLARWAYRNVIVIVLCPKSLLNVFQAGASHHQVTCRSVPQIVEPESP